MLGQQSCTYTVQLCVQAPPTRMEDVPEWEKAFYQAPSDASDDEDLNRCSDDDSDIGMEHF